MCDKQQVRLHFISYYLNLSKFHWYKAIYLYSVQSTLCENKVDSIKVYDNVHFFQFVQVCQIYLLVKYQA